MGKFKLIILVFLGLIFFISSCFAVELSCDYALIEATLTTLYNDKNRDKAKSMIEPCARAGDSASQLALGYVYLDKSGGNNSNFFLWSEKATCNGNIVALFKHALNIDIFGSEAGLGWFEAQFLSLDWYLKAAEGGHPDALFAIGSKMKRYSTDKVMAYTFFVLAERRVDASFDNYNFITSYLNEMELTEKVSDEEIKEAIGLADLWERNHPDAAKTWPSDDWVANMKGEEAEQIPVLKSAPTSKTFCEIFGKVMMYCPQESEISDAEKKALRPGYVAKH